MNSEFLNLLARLEETQLSTSLRESGLAFFSTLAIHSISMAFAVGVNVAAALLLLAGNNALGVERFNQFYSFNRWALGIVAVSGAALVLAYPAKALTNPVFYFKICLLLSGLALSLWFSKWFQSPHKDQMISTLPAKLATSSLLIWAGVIAAGRFLAYTNSILLASSFY